SRAADSTRRTPEAQPATAAPARRTAPKPTPRPIRGPRPRPLRMPAAPSQPHRRLLKLKRKQVLKKEPHDNKKHRAGHRPEFRHDGRRLDATRPTRFLGDLVCALQDAETAG